jgi:hypothetical protein
MSMRLPVFSLLSLGAACAGRRSPDGAAAAGPDAVAPQRTRSSRSIPAGAAVHGGRSIDRGRAGGEPDRGHQRTGARLLPR